MTKNYLIILIAFIFFSCSKEAEVKKKPSINFKVSLDEAKLVANNAVQFLNKGKGSNKKILKKHALNGVTVTYKGDASFYVFNYAEGGFVVVAADKRSIPILAYSDDSDYSFDVKDKPLGLTLWENATKQNIESLEKENVAQTAILDAWDQTSCGDTPIERIACGDDGEDEITVIERGPLMQSRWNQLCGYNTFCPSFSNADSWRMCDHMPTGCVATSMAQIMRYWQYPNNYSWNNMPFNIGSGTTSRLMRDIGDAVHMNYAPEGSGAYTRDVNGAFINTFGYANAEYRQRFNDDYTAIMNNITLHWPVILTGCTDRENGSCHAWVCDGFQHIYINGYGYLNLHMNWGWGGIYNGWYVFDNWNINELNNRNYQYFQEMVLNIHP